MGNCKVYGGTQTGSYATMPDILGSGLTEEQGIAIARSEIRLTVKVYQSASVVDEEGRIIFSRAIESLLTNGVHHYGVIERGRKGRILTGGIA